MDCLLATVLILAVWFVDDFSYAIRKLTRSISGLIDAVSERTREEARRENSDDKE